MTKPLAPPIPRRVSAIDWRRWVAHDRATLLFVVRDETDEVLLIRKKRGLGAGKINGPGGRLEPDETPRACAIREVEEELRITPTGVDFHGELLFQFVDGYSIHGYVYRAAGFEGSPTETDEARPVWTRTGAIPYTEMWADDAIWLPALLAGRSFFGRFIFDGDTMLDQHVEFDIELDPH